MSASQIPNLNTLRRGGPRLRGRGRDVGDGDRSSQPLRNKDDIIRRTDVDASTSRLSAVETGYLDDPFAKLLTARGEAARRLPLMNRGTYVRTSGIDRLVDSFYNSTPKRRKQIISLGAGSDTRFFRLKRKYADLDLVYHEVDFPSNASAKIGMLQSGPARNTTTRMCDWDVGTASIVETSDGIRSLHTQDYHIHSLDLRTLPGASLHDLKSGWVGLTDIDSGLPTLLISECCLIYLSPPDAASVLSYFDRLFAPTVDLGIVVYEPIRPDDAFGRTMVSNLTARGIHLQTLQTYASLRAQSKRLQEHGFGEEAGGGIGTADVEFIWRHWIDDVEKERVEGLEWMDEVEEWKLLMQHYCVVWGWRGQDASSASFNGWKGLVSQGVED